MLDESYFIVYDSSGCLLYEPGRCSIALFTKVMMHIHVRYNGSGTGTTWNLQDVNGSDVVTSESIYAARLTEVTFQESLFGVHLKF
jgi:hypothetical protein